MKLIPGCSLLHTGNQLVFMINQGIAPGKHLHRTQGIQSGKLLHQLCLPAGDAVCGALIQLVLHLFQPFLPQIQPSLYGAYRQPLSERL